MRRVLPVVHENNSGKLKAVALSDQPIGIAETMPERCRKLPGKCHCWVLSQELLASCRSLTRKRGKG